MQNDWVALNLLNKDLSIESLAANGINASNTGIRPKEDYLKSSDIQDLFKNEQGNFDEKEFDKAYNQLMQSYVSFFEIDQKQYLEDNYHFDPYDINRTADDKIKRLNFNIEKVKNPFETSYGFLEGKEGNRVLSISELAQKNKYYDNETGKWSDKTPNELGALGVLGEKTLVLATYDKDEEEIFENGRIIKHKKGEYKKDPDGKFYYETAYGKEVYNKEMLGALDVLSTDGSGWNKIDIFDTDDIKVHPLKSIGRAIAIISPYLIPGAGEYYALASAAMFLTESMPSVIKTISGLVNPNYKPGANLNNFENFTKKMFTTTSSEYSRDHMFSFENIMNIAASSGSQLFQQRAVANIPRLLGFDKRMQAAVSNVTKGVIDDAVEMGIISKEGAEFYANALANGKKIDSSLESIIQSMPQYKKAHDIYSKYMKQSEALSRAYLVATSASNVYGDAINDGFDRQTASLISLGVYLGYDAFFRTDYMRRFLRSGIDLEEDANNLRQAVYLNLKRRGKDHFANELKEKGALGIIQKGRQMLHESWDDVIKGGRSNVATAMFSEGVEETMEELMMDASKEIFGNGLNALKEQFGYDTAGHFNYLASNPLKRYFQSFVGGAIGGGIFGLETEFRTRGGADSWNKMFENRPELGRTIFRYVNSGKTDSLIKMAESFRGKAFASQSLSYWDRNEDGSYKATTKKGESQNDFIIDSFISYVRNLDKLLDQEGLRTYFNKSGISSVDRTINALTMSNHILASDNDNYIDFVSNEISNLQIKLYDLFTKINEAERSDNKDENSLNLLKIEYNKTKDKIVALKNGADEDVFGMMLAHVSPTTFGNGSLSNVKHFAKMMYDMDYDKIKSEDLKALIDSKYSSYVNSGEHLHDSWIAYKQYLEFHKSKGDWFNDYKNSLDITHYVKLDPKYGLPTIQIRGLNYDDIYNEIYAYFIDENEDPEDAKELAIGYTNTMMLSMLTKDEQSSSLRGILRINIIPGYDFLDGDTYEKLVNIINQGLQYDYDQLSLQFPDRDTSKDFLFDKTFVDFYEDYDYDDAEISAIEAINSSFKSLGIDSFIDTIDSEWDTYSEMKETYELSDDVKRKLLEYLKLWPTIRGWISGGVNNNHGSISGIISKFRKDNGLEDKDSGLKDINKHLYTEILNYFDLIKKKIDLLVSVSDANKSNEVNKEMRLSCKIKEENLDIFNKLSAVWDGQQDKPQFTRFDKEEIPVNEEGLIEYDIKLEAIQIKNEKNLYQYYSNLNDDEKREFIKSLKDIFHKYHTDSSYLSLDNKMNESEEHTIDARGFWYILNNCLQDPDFFYYPYKNAVNNIKSEDKLAPFYSQEIIAKYIVNFLFADKKDLSLISETMNLSGETDLWTKLENSIRLVAGNGTGKTTGIIPLVSKVIKEIDSSTDFHFISSSSAAINRLNATEDKKSTTSKFFDDLKLGLKFDGKFICNDKETKTLSEILKDNIGDDNYLRSVDNKLFANSRLSLGAEHERKLKAQLKGKIIFIDEATYISTYEYAILEWLSKEIGFRYVIMGDVLQDGYTDDNGTMNFNRTISFLTPALISSKRVTTNIGEYNNLQLRKYALGESNSVDFQWGEKEGVLYGIKRDGNLNINQFIKDHPDSKILIFSSDESSPSGPNVVRRSSIIDIQGDEFDYVLVDGENGFTEILVDPIKLNTLFSRARNGVVVYGDISVNIKTVEINSEFIYFKGIDNEQNISRYLDYRKKTIHSLNPQKIEKQQPLNSGDTNITSPAPVPTPQPIPTPEPTPTVVAPEPEPEPTPESVVEPEVVTPEPEVVAPESVVPDPVIETTPDPEPEQFEELYEEVVEITESPTIQDPIDLAEKTVEAKQYEMKSLRMYSFYNRLGGNIERDEYIVGAENEDINIFLGLQNGGCVSINDEMFQEAYKKLSILKNQLYYKLGHLNDPQKKLIDEIPGDGKFLVKVSKYNPEIDALWFKENYNQLFDVNDLFRRIVYQYEKDGAKHEVTLFVFPNKRTVHDNSPNNESILKYINDNFKLEKYQTETYWNINHDLFRFVEGIRPIFLRPIDLKSYVSDTTLSTQMTYKNGEIDWQHSFLQTTEPYHFTPTYLSSKGYFELCDNIDKKLKACHKLFSQKFPNYANPFEYSSGKVTTVPRIIKSNDDKSKNLTIFVRLNLGEVFKPGGVISRYFGDLESWDQQLEFVLQELNKNEPDYNHVYEKSQYKFEWSFINTNCVYTHEDGGEFIGNIKSYLHMLQNKQDDKSQDQTLKNIQDIMRYLNGISAVITANINQEFDGLFNKEEWDNISKYIKYHPDLMHEWAKDDKKIAEVAEYYWKFYKSIYDYNGFLKGNIKQALLNSGYKHPWRSLFIGYTIPNRTDGNLFKATDHIDGYILSSSTDYIVERGWISFLYGEHVTNDGKKEYSDLFAKINDSQTVQEQESVVEPVVEPVVEQEDTKPSPIKKVKRKSRIKTEFLKAIKSADLRRKITQKLGDYEYDDVMQILQELSNHEFSNIEMQKIKEASEIC